MSCTGIRVRLYLVVCTCLCFTQDSLPQDFQLDPRTFTEVIMAMDVGGELRWALVPASMLFREVRGCWCLNFARCLACYSKILTLQKDEKLYSSG